MKLSLGSIRSIALLLLVASQAGCATYGYRYGHRHHPHRGRTVIVVR